MGLFATMKRLAGISEPTAAPKNTGPQLTPEYMREWERALGPEGMRRAFDIAEQVGWTRGSMPPIWVWAQIYAQVERETGICRPFIVLH